MSYSVTLISGDGIGPEVASATQRVVNATGVKVDWEPVELNAEVIQKAGQVLPQHVLDSLDRTKVGLKGPVTTPIAGGFPSVNVALRKKLDLFANVRPVRTLPGVKTRYMDVNIDMVIFRENTEDVYSGLEHEVIKDVVESLKIITRYASIRIARAAFEFAKQEGRKQVTAVHKANIMKLSDGLFLRCCRETAAAVSRDSIPGTYRGQRVNANRDEAGDFRYSTDAELVWRYCFRPGGGPGGWIGNRAGGHMGERHAVFEAVHGSAPDIAGKGLANPTALMLSAVMMLKHLGEVEASIRLQAAIEAVYADGKRTTADVGGFVGTSEFTDAIVSKLG